MRKNTRIWIGITLLVIVIFNYLAIGVPLYNRVNSLQSKIKVFSKNSEDSYIIDILKKEIVILNSKITLLNRIAISVTIIIISWIIFSLVFFRESRRNL